MSDSEDDDVSAAASAVIELHAIDPTWLSPFHDIQDESVQLAVQSSSHVANLRAMLQYPDAHVQFGLHNAVPIVTTAPTTPFLMEIASTMHASPDADDTRAAIQERLKRNAALNAKRAQQPSANDDNDQLNDESNNSNSDKQPEFPRQQSLFVDTFRFYDESRYMSRSRAAIKDAIDAFVQSNLHQGGYEEWRCLICQNSFDSLLLSADHLRTNHRLEMLNALTALTAHSDKELNRNGNMLSKLLHQDVAYPERSLPLSGSVTGLPNAWALQNDAQPPCPPSATPPNRFEADRFGLSENAPIEMMQLVYGVTPNAVPLVDDTGRTPARQAARERALVSIVADVAANLHERVKNSERMKKEADAEIVRQRNAEQARIKAEIAAKEKAKRDREDKAKAKRREEQARLKAEAKAAKRLAARRRDAAFDMIADNLIRVTARQLVESMCTDLLNDILDKRRMNELFNKAVKKLSTRVVNRIIQDAAADNIVDIVNDCWKQHQQELIKQKVLERQTKLVQDNLAKERQEKIEQAQMEDQLLAALREAEDTARQETTPLPSILTRQPITYKPQSSSPAASSSMPYSSESQQFAPTLGEVAPASVFTSRPTPVDAFHNSYGWSNLGNNSLPSEPSAPQPDRRLSSGLSSVVGAPITSNVTPSLSSSAIRSTDQTRLSAALRANPTPTLPVTPAIGELPGTFGLVESQTVLIYNLARRRVNRPEIIQLLSGCTVAVNADFESLIRFVHTDGGGISALVQLGTQADVKRALSLSGTLLDGRPAYITQQWTLSHTAPRGAATLAQRNPDADLHIRAPPGLAASTDDDVMQRLGSIGDESATKEGGGATDDLLSALPPLGVGVGGASLASVFGDSSGTTDSPSLLSTLLGGSRDGDDDRNDNDDDAHRPGGDTLPMLPSFFDTGANNVALGTLDTLLEPDDDTAASRSLNASIDFDENDPGELDDSHWLAKLASTDSNSTSSATSESTTTRRRLFDR